MYVLAFSIPLYVLPLIDNASFSCSAGVLLRMSILISRCRSHHVRRPLFTPLRTCLRFLLSSTAFYNLTEQVNCPAFGQSAQVLGNVAIGSATLNILYRAWAISLRYSRLLTISLAVAEIGHWGLLIWNVFTVHSEWVASVRKCNVTITSRTALVTLYVYSTSPFHSPGDADFNTPSPQRCFLTLRSLSYVLSDF